VTFAIDAFAVQFEESRRDRFDAVGLGRACQDLFAAGIASFGNRAQRLSSQFARRFQIDGGERTERVFARLSIVAIAHGPALCASWVNDEIKAAQKSVGDLPSLGSRARGFDRPCCEFCHCYPLLGKPGVTSLACLALSGNVKDRDGQKPIKPTEYKGYGGLIVGGCQLLSLRHD
jgi:hypothetical protein